MTKKKKKPNHVHKYKRMNLTRNPDKKPYMVFVCQMPACEHYLPVQLALGKMAACSRCGDPFIIDKVSIDHALPHCNECIKKKVKPEIAELNELVKDI